MFRRYDCPVINAVNLSNGGIAILYQNGEVRLWINEFCFTTLKDVEAQAIAVLPDGNIVTASGFQQQELIIWSPSGEKINAVPYSSSSGIITNRRANDLATLSDGTIVLIVRDKIYLWSSTGEPIATLRKKNKKNDEFDEFEYFTCLATLPGGTGFVVGSNKGNIYIASSKEWIATLSGHTDRINSIAVLPNGSIVSSTSSLGIFMRVWSPNLTPRSSTLPSCVVS